MIEQLREMKRTTTYFELSKRLNIPAGTLQRWISRGRMNRVYAEFIRGKLQNMGG